jgi:hypothetical protein
MDVLELLLSAKPQKLPEKDFKLTRLSKEIGGNVVFRLRALPFSRVAEIRKIDEGEQSIHIILAGVISPDLRNEELRNKYEAATPADMVKALLLPGEIDDLAHRIEKLSGYRTVVVAEEIKKN